MDDRIFEYRGEIYPEFIKQWKMSEYIAPTAKNFCQGVGIDVGAGEHPFPGAKSVDLTQQDKWDAFNLPTEDGELDYIFSSHCLEHISDFVGALEYWITKIKSGGVLFLYLPSWNCEYWRPWNNRKHVHQFEPHHLKDCLENLGLDPVLVSGIDLARSFSCVGFKQ